MSPFALVSLLSFGTSIILASLVWFRGPRSLVNRAFAFFCLLAAYLSFTEFGLRQADSFETAYFWLKASAFWPIILPALLHFALAFTEQSRLLSNRSTYVLLYAPALALSLLGLTTELMTTGLAEEYWGWTDIHGKNVVSYIASSWVFIVSVLTTYLCLRYYLRTAERHRKQQARCVLIGISILLVVGFIAEPFLTLLQTKIPDLVTPAFAIGSVFIGYGIWKYRLFALTAATAAESILSTMSHLLFLVNPEGRIMKVNQAALGILGYREEGLIGRDVGAILTNGGGEEALVNWAGPTGQLTSNAMRDAEMTAKTRLGERIPISVSTSPVRTEDGSLQGIVCIAQDITERKQAEEALRKAHDELEIRVEERTIELAKANQALQVEIIERKRAEGELKQTMADLARSNAELQEFAYMASHDLQEPLRMVTSYVQLLARRYRGELDADADDFIAYAVDGTSRMQRMINDLLAYSRVGTSGKDFGLTDCAVVLDQTIANLQVAIEESGAVITHDPLPSVTADASQLVQLFQNLISNAIKFRDEEPLHVHVSAERKGDEMVFSIRDNGIGIDPEHIDHVFRTFQRLHSKGEYPGMGIGLAICRRIVERHGGCIWVESQSGKGSTFYFTIFMTRR